MEGSPPAGVGLSATVRPVRALAIAAVAASALVWGCSSVIIKLISTTGLVASFYRLWIPLPLLWSLPLVLPGMRRRLTRAWLVASLAGGALFALHQILFFTSLKLTSVTNVSIIGALQPALVVIVAGPWFGERVSGRALFWSCVAVVGTVIVVVGSAGTPGWSARGDVIAVANLFAFTAYFLVSKHVRAGVGTAEYLIGMSTVAAVIILAVTVAAGENLQSPHGNDWVLLVLLALLPGTLGHFLTNWAHPHVDALVVSVMLLAVPVFAALGAAAFLDEPLNLTQVTGGIVVLAAIGTIVYERPAADAEELAASAAETDTV